MTKEVVQERSSEEISLLNTNTKYWGRKNDLDCARDKEQCVQNSFQNSFQNSGTSPVPRKIRKCAMMEGPLGIRGAEAKRGGLGYKKRKKI